MRKFILGTDWWTDCDDAVAVRVLARSVKAGKIDLLGVGINACMKDSVSSLDAFLHHEGMELPIGIDHAAVDYTGYHTFQMRMAPKAVKYKSNEDAEDAVRLYRRLLAGADGKVEILEIGFLQVIANVLQSDGDDISPFSGMELFEQKVEKVWVMAGKWDDDPGSEHNFNLTWRSREAGDIFCRLCPVPVTFLGFEAGVNVISGGNLQPGDMLYDLLQDHGSYNGRSSWDPMTALMAVIGDEAAAGYDVVCGRAYVDPVTGWNSFVEIPAGPHKYVKCKHAPEEYAAQINKIIE